MRLRNPQGLRAKISKNVAIDPTDEGCIEWIETGFHAVSWNDETHSVPEWAWALKTGELPAEGQTIHHKCGNSRCCNAEHLELIEAEPAIV
jgi:hypothetical protein